jgi:hypothetical protein
MHHGTSTTAASESCADYGNWLNQFNVDILGCLATWSFYGQEVTR